jgi:5'-3' exoribonuclease 2
MIPLVAHADRPNAAEERAKENAKFKRRRVDTTVTVTTTSSGPSAALQLTAPPTAPGLPAHPSLPAKPGVDDFAQRANSLGLGANGDGSSAVSANVLQALSGSNSDIVANRAAIRMANMANMNAAEMLKAELAGLRPVKATSRTVMSAPAEPAAVPSAPDVSATGPVSALDESMGDDEVPGFGAASNVVETTSKTTVMVAEDGEQTQPIANSNLVHGIDVAGSSIQSRRYRA